MSVCDIFLSTGNLPLFFAGLHHQSHFRSFFGANEWDGGQITVKHNTRIKLGGAVDRRTGEYPAGGSCGKAQLTRDALGPTYKDEKGAKMLFL